MQRRGNTPTLKLDLTNDEILVTKPVLSEIFHPYSDVNDNNKIQAYKLEEIFAY
tara:strand:+ start:14922 stop:15083 length:162 start_codon:yes stop_codon:yes gene_type:complete